MNPDRDPSELSDSPSRTKHLGSGLQRGVPPLETANKERVARPTRSKSDFGVGVPGVAPTIARVLRRRMIRATLIRMMAEITGGDHLFLQKTLKNLLP